MVKILLFGTGSIGGVCGYILSRAGVEITAVCRGNYDIVRENGIRIDSSKFGQVQYRPHVVRSVDEAVESLKPRGRGGGGGGSSSSTQDSFDYVVVSCKALPGTAALIRQAAGPGTAIVLAQNGIGIEAEYARLYPDSAVISGVVFISAEQTSPGHVTMGVVERFGAGTYPHDAPAAHKAKAEGFVRLWNGGGGNGTVYDDIQGPRWAKLCLNASFNPLCALTRLDTANLLLSSPGADPLVVQVIREVGKVAASLGYKEYSTQEKIDETLAYHRQRMKVGGKDPSMLMDVKAGRAIEVDAIVGNVVKLAREQNLEVPTLQMLHVLLVALEFGRERPSESWMQPVV